MSQPLPVDGFTWVDIGDWSHSTIATMELVKGTGLILEVDLTFPKHLHDKFSDYPLAPTHTAITEEMLSPFSRLVDSQIILTAKFFNLNRDKANQSVIFPGKQR